MNFIHFKCNDCAETGFVSKQLTDGYQLNCYRCGSSNTEEIKEVSMKVV